MSFVLRSRPDFFSWCCAIGGALITIAAALVLRDLALSLRGAISARHFREDVQRSDFLSSKRYLQIASSTHLSPIPLNRPAVFPDLAPATRADFAGKLLLVIEQTTQLNLLNAEKGFNEIETVFASRAEFGTLSDEEKRFVESLGAEKVRIHAAAETRRLSDEKTEEAKTIIAAASALRDRYLLLSHQLSDLLTLPEEPLRETPPTPADFYQAGVLSGLPRLKDLPDNLMNLAALRVELKNLGGSVKMKGESAYEQFMAQITETRAGCDALRRDTEAQQKLVEETQRESLRHRRLLREQSAVITDALTPLVSRLISRTWNDSGLP